MVRPLIAARGPLGTRLLGALVLALLALPLGCAAPAGGGAGAKPAPTTAAAAPAGPVPPSAPPAAAAAATTAPTPAARVPVRYATQRPVSEAGVFIAYARGYFGEAGIDLELVDVPSANDMIPLLATGEIEAGGVAPIAAVFNAVARGVDLKTVAERGSNAPGYGFSALVVRKDLVDGGRFQSYADLKGKQIGVSPPAGGGGVSVELLAALEQVGLEWGDVDAKALGFQDLDAALRNGSLDAMITVEPWVSRAVSGGYGVRWQGADEIYPNHMLGGLAYSPVFAARSPEVARAFMLAYVRGVRVYNDALGKNQGRDDVYAILAEHSTVKDRAVLAGMILPGINPDPYTNRASVQRDQEAFIKMGTVQERVDIDLMIDDQYVRYAVERLGPYR